MNIFARLRALFARRPSPPDPWDNVPDSAPFPAPPNLWGNPWSVANRKMVARYMVALRKHGRR